MQIVPVVPPGRRGSLEVEDDKAMAEEIELAALEHRQVPKIVLQPPCLCLSSDKEADSKAVGGPGSAEILEHSPAGQLEQDDVRQHGEVKPQVCLEEPCLLEILAQLTKVLLQRFVSRCEHVEFSVALPVIIPQIILV